MKLGVGFKAEARVSAYFTIGVEMWVYFCGWGVCEGVGIYVYMVGMCEEGGNVYIWKEGEEKLHHYIIFVTLSSIVHEKNSIPST